MEKDGLRPTTGEAVEKWRHQQKKHQLAQSLGELRSLLSETVEYFGKKLPNSRRQASNRQQVFDNMTRGQQWGYFYSEFLTPNDIERIDKEKMSDEQVQALIKERKQE